MSFSTVLKAPRTVSRSLTLRATRFASTQSKLSSVLKRGAPIDIHPEVQEALATNKPVVALETALVTHGFPYPENVKLAMSLEDIVRSTGSIPATIGLIGGRMKIGMEEKELVQLAENKEPAKISRRDIGPAIAMKADGGTTCSATLIFAALAGIKVFATGGLGGVHRGGETSMDISADLGELTRCPVGLVSSGVKSILDIGRTLEYLETLGVPVLTYGSSREFPAFFSRHSGFDAPWNVNDPLTAAKILHTQWQLGFNNGALIAVPIPAEFEEAGLAIQKLVDQAVAESEENGVSRRGRDATPWLLSRIGELSRGSSLISNIALLKNTALVGGNIAVQYHKLATTQECIPLSQLEHSHISRPQQQERRENSLPPADLVVIGSAAIDITAQTRPDVDNALANHSTAPGTVSVSLGGVARNIAEASHRVITSQSPNLSLMLVSAVGNDPFGRLLVDETVQLGMRVDGFVQSNKGTAICNMILDGDGDLIGGVADMGITADLTGDTVIPQLEKHKPRLVALDGNMTPEAIRNIVGHCIQNNIEVFFEPTSVVKSTNILPAISASLDISRSQAPIAFASPNILELAHLEEVSRGGPLELTSHPAWWHVIDSLGLDSKFRYDLEQLARNNVVEGDSSKGTLAFLVDRGVTQMAVKLLPFFQHLVVKCGAQGVLVVMRISSQAALTSSWAEPSRRYITSRGSSGEIFVVQHFSPLHVEKVINVTGAGDSFVGALLASLARQPDTFQDPNKLSDVMFAAQTAATLSLQSHHAVSPLLSIQSDPSS